MYSAYYQYPGAIYPQQQQFYQMQQAPVSYPQTSQMNYKSSTQTHDRSKMRRNHSRRRQHTTAPAAVNSQQQMPMPQQ